MAFTIELDESTAARRRVPFRVFNSDGTSPDTGFSETTVLHSINGGAQVVSTNSSSVLSANAGMYYIELTQAEVGTLGSMAIFVCEQSADFEQHVANVQVVNSNPFSTESHGNYLKPTTAGRTLDVTATGEAGIDWSNIGAPTTEVNLSGTTVLGATKADNVTQTLAVNVTQLGGVAQSATDLKDFADAGYDPATNKVQGVVLVDTTTTNTDMVAAAPTAAANADAVWDEAASGHVAAGSFGAQCGTDIDAILVDTGEIGVAGAGLTDLGGMSTSMKGQVNTEADTALSDYGALKPTTAGRTLDVTVGGAAGVDWANVEAPTTEVNLSGTTVLGTTRADNVTQTLSVTAATVNDKTDYTLSAAGRNLVAVDSADSVWDELASDHVVDGSFGRRLAIIDSGQAQDGEASGISLRAGASSTNDFYNNTVVVVVSGTGAGQARFINDYIGTERSALVNDNWVTAPDSTSNYVIIPFGSIPGASAPTAAQNADAVWDEARADHVAAGSFGQYVPTDVIVAGSGVTLHAGTHSDVTIKGIENYANISDVTLHTGTHTGAVVPTVTDVTNTVSANAVQISGDATAADNLEAAFDGTGYNSALTVFVKDSIATIAGVTNTATLINALNDIDGSAVTLHAGTHSAATIQGLSNYANISNVTLHTGTHTGAVVPTVTDVTNPVTIANANYSAVTVRVDSSVTIAGVTNVATQILALNDIDGSAVTLHAGTHSDVTIQGVTNLSGIAAGTIVAADFAAGAIDAAALAGDAVNEIADGVLDRNMATGVDSGSSAVRTPRDALRALRNRVVLSGNTMTVYKEDDTTAKWTASLTTTGDSSFPTAFDPNS